MGFLLNSELKSLLPDLMLFAATQSIEARGTKSIVDFENHLTHPQVAFPKVLHDVDYFIPVNENEAGEHLEGILEQVEKQVYQAAAKGEYPLTYAVYARYLKGTNGGLSTTSTNSSDEHILAVDVVTHPQAQGIDRFEAGFLAYLKEKNLNFRNHLGKDFSYGVVRYDQFLEPDNIKAFVEAAQRWNATPGENDGAERLAMAPYNVHYLQKMLDRKPILENKFEVEKPSDKKEHIEYSNEEHLTFLTRLCEAVTLMPVHGDATQNAKTAFLKICHEELENRKLRHLVIA
jgi:L-gulonolactone oxidase